VHSLRYRVTIEYMRAQECHSAVTQHMLEGGDDICFRFLSCFELLGVAQILQEYYSAVTQHMLEGGDGPPGYGGGGGGRPPYDAHGPSGARTFPCAL